MLMAQSVDRAIQVLMFVASRPRSINDVAEHLGVHPTTALRILHTLLAWRMLNRRPDGSYRLGAAVIELGHRALEAVDIRDIAQPFMRQIHEATGETVHLALLENDHVVYIDKIESQHPVRMYSRIGLVAPLHCTGVSKAILAFLDDEQRVGVVAKADFTAYTAHTLTTPETLLADLALSRERGYALDDEEHELGIRCVAAPILHADGSVAASVSVSTAGARVDRERLLSYVEPLFAGTRAAARELGRSPE
jgi:DNA-binding IclR family transcriptional regulator